MSKVKGTVVLVPQRDSRKTSSHVVEPAEASTASRGCVKVAGTRSTGEQMEARAGKEKTGREMWDVGRPRTMLRPCSRLSRGNVKV